VLTSPFLNFLRSTFATSAKTMSGAHFSTVDLKRSLAASRPSSATNHFTATHASTTTVNDRDLPEADRPSRSADALRRHGRDPIELVDQFPPDLGAEPVPDQAHRLLLQRVPVRLGQPGNLLDERVVDATEVDHAHRTPPSVYALTRIQALRPSQPDCG
jgi:hypothetical protein